MNRPTRWLLALICGRAGHDPWLAGPSLVRCSKCGKEWQP